MIRRVAFLIETVFLELFWASLMMLVGGVTPETVDDELNDMMDLVRRDRAHPSVVLWSFCNEVGCNNESSAQVCCRFLFVVDWSIIFAVVLISFAIVEKGKAAIFGCSPPCFLPIVSFSSCKDVF